MSRQNIPPLLEQYRENMLDPKSPMSVRHNYMMNLRNIRDFCDASLREYDKKVKKI